MTRPRPALGNRVYEALLHAFPPDVRAEAGSDMARQFAAERAARRGRPLALARLWTAAIADAVWHGLLDRLSIRPGVSARSGQGPARDVRGWIGRAVRFGLAALTTDVKLAVRRLAATPTFTAVAVVTLALGIGANSAIFSVVNGVLLRPLPFPDSTRLVGLFQVWDGQPDAFSSPNFLDVQARAETLQSAGAYDDIRRTLTGAGDPVVLRGAAVTTGFFETLATPLLHGRTFRSEEHEEARTAVVVLGYALWRDRFGADPSVLGQRIVLDGQPHEVVGIMPDGFAWPAEAAFWVPAEYTTGFRSGNRGLWYLGAIGRLAPGATVTSAAAEVAAIGEQLETEYPADNTHLGMTAVPLLDAVVGDSRRALLVLLTAVSFVLLIACANVANLMLARSATRRVEMAMCVALGASRLQLARQVLVESLLLAILGGVAGLGLAYAGTGALVALGPDLIPRLGAVEVDRAVLVFTAAAVVATGLLFGLVPVGQLTRAPAVTAIREGGRSRTPGKGARRLRSGLIVAETALALLLLVGAGLLMRSFVKISLVDPGFAVARALTFHVLLPEADYPDDARRLAFYDRLRERLAAVPGVTDVGLALAVPPAGSIANLTFTVRGRPPVPPGEEPSLEVRLADAAFFRVMGIPLRQGRLFDDTDRRGDGVVLLTETAVRRYFAGEDPIGQHLDLGLTRDTGTVGGTIVGVVGDVRSYGIDLAPPPLIYVPLSQLPNASMSVILRTQTDPTSLVGVVRTAVADLDPGLAITEAMPLARHVSESMGDRRFYALLLGVFAGVAVALAAVGIFGVLACLVSERARELGIRLALGARPSGMVRLVVGRTVGIVGIGVGLGLAGAFGLAWTLQALLFELEATDPVTLIAAAALLIAVAVVAAWVPARRASTVDPVAVLRE